jgi:hypothetical protein
MATFAILDSNNKVTNVIVVDDNDVINNGGNYSIEAENFVKNMLKLDNIKQCSTDGTRFNMPGIKSIYDPIKNAFINEKPFLSWVLNTNNYQWESPTPAPTDVISVDTPDFYYFYKWDESTLSWIAEHNGIKTHVWNKDTLAWDQV